MSTTRKEFIKTSSFFLGGLLLGGAKFDFFQQNLGKGFRIINDNIGIYTENGGAILWYVSKDGCAVVDAQFPDSAKNLFDGLKSKYVKKIDYLFNTHHHPDHTAGNFYLKDFADKIIANENCARLQKIKNGGGEKDKTQAYPDTTFQSQGIYGLVKEQIQAYHFYPAHTGGDSIYHFVNSNVVHMGDIVFNGFTPYFNLSDEGSLTTWIKCLEKAVSLFSNDTIFIFGHSADPEKVIGKKEDLIKMSNYISMLLDYVSKGKAAGKSKEEICGAIDAARFGNIAELRPGMLKNNAEQAFEELIRGK